MVNVRDFKFTDYYNPDGQRNNWNSTYRSTLEWIAETIEIKAENSLRCYWGDTKPEQQLITEFGNLNRHSSIRDLIMPRSEQGLKDCMEAIRKRQAELIESVKPYTKWDMNKLRWVKETDNA